MINIFIADDHPLVRAGFKKLIEDEIDLQVVGETGDNGDLLSLLKDSKTDILILDVKMPSKNVIEVIKEVKTFHSEIMILIISMLPETHYTIRLIKAGAAGYITKDKALKTLVEAIRILIKRGKYISSNLANILMNELEKDNYEFPHRNLTDREYEVMCLLAKGLKVKEIAKQINLSKSTVHTYRSRILSKMNLTTTIDLARYAMENNLL